MSQPTAAGRGSSVARAIAVSVLRGGLISAAVIAGTLVVGDAKSFGAEVWVLVAFYLVLWTAIIIGYLAWSLRRIDSAARPEIRALETLVVTAVLVIAMFSKAYHLISVAEPSAFSEPLDAFTAYYFAVTVLATVGFGDITPVITPARAIAMVQMVIDLALLATLVRLVTSAVKVNHLRRSPDGVR
ncbi:MAG: potassium channel family protein [Candidatus Nanopelagicales bacterium]